MRRAWCSRGCSSPARTSTESCRRHAESLYLQNVGVVGVRFGQGAKLVRGYQTTIQILWRDEVFGDFDARVKIFHLEHCGMVRVREDDLPLQKEHHVLDAVHRWG